MNDSLIKELAILAQLYDRAAYYCETAPLSPIDDQDLVDKETHKNAARSNRLRAKEIRLAIEAISLLIEAREILKHTRCIDDDAMKCPACSLESRISSILEWRA